LRGAGTQKHAKQPQGAYEVKQSALVIVIMGVSGSGKTTVGSLLAGQLGWEFADADDYHSAANIEKMRSGIPLSDADRRPWLDQMRTLIDGWIASGENAVLACSALRAAYRQFLRASDEVRFVYLKGDRNLLSRRLMARPNHYMKEPMLASQISTLEEPVDAVVVDAREATEHIVAKIRAALLLS
jgi:gluconokinase